VKPSRVLEMGWGEIAERGVQELRKRFERHGLAGERRPVRGVLDVLAHDRALDPARALAQAGDAAGAERWLLDRFTTSCSARFFEGATSPEVPALLRDRMSAAGAALEKSAAALLAGRFDLLGYRGLDFGDPPDWHLDPVSGRRAPFTHWSHIDYLDAARVGDSKVIWELNRHQWLVRLGQAYRITGDERYADRFAAVVRDWMRANPPGMGINWASSLEVAFRLIAWCWALVLFRGAQALDTDLYARMLESAGAHAGHVERYLSRYFSPNTHLTGEALGLCYAGALFPELRGAARWRRLGAEILDEQFPRQVLADGVHFERSTCYHRYTAEIYLHFAMLQHRAGRVLEPALLDRLERMIEALLTLRQPDGALPHIGDGDAGRLLPLAPRAVDDARDLFSIAAVVFHRSDFAWAAGGVAPEACWLLGPDAVDVFARLVSRPPATSTSTILSEGGFAAMRSGWGPRAHWLVLDGGPLGCPVTAGHGHADLLAIQCAVSGEPMIVDPGTYVYTADARWRDAFRDTSAHSTITVDDVGQAIPAGPFAWRARPGARLRRLVTATNLDVAEAEHDAYTRLPDPVTHRRRVLWAKPDYWVIVDDLDGAAEHTIDVRYQFAPIDMALGQGLQERDDRAREDEPRDAAASGERDRADARGRGDVPRDGRPREAHALWARAEGKSGAVLFVRAFAPTPLTARVLEGSEHPTAGWISPNYGQRRPAPCLVYRTRSTLPLRIATLLFPAGPERPRQTGRSTTPTAPAVTPTKDERGVLTGLRIAVEDRYDLVTFDQPETRRTVLA